MRIVAGLAKGRRLATPAGATRPTSDRTREALFNTLAARVLLEGARVLDLYAGTGAVGLEALSRGAAEAVLVEKDRRALEVLRRNVESVGLPGARVVSAPVAQFLKDEPKAPFDLVFADPPYAVEDAEVAAALTRLRDGGWFSEEAVVVIERSARGEPPEWSSTLLTSVLERRYGDTVLWYGRPR